MFVDSWAQSDEATAYVMVFYVVFILLLLVLATGWIVPTRS